jgi:ssDNA-binding Zn-finger/Zn-ribbon topoisomerase 1
MNIKTKEKNENEESINMLCPLCSSRLTLKFINKNNKILLCENKECLFPMNQLEMDKFIFNINIDNSNEFILNINKLIEQLISNGTEYKEEIKKGNKEELKFDSKNSDFSDIMSNSEHPFLDSFSENDNLRF